MKRKYSIIVPVYNVEKYISQCLMSLIHQSYDNIEIIVINDGSSDNSLSIISRFQNIDDRVIVINQENKGLGYTRNVGIECATGDYILFIDSDDYISLDTCAKIEDFLSIKQCDIIVLGRYRFGDNYCKKDQVSKDLFTFQTGELYLLHAVQYNCFTASSCNKIFRRSFLCENMLRFEPDILYEDLLFVFKSLIISSSLGVIDDPCYYYRWNRKDSIINTIKDRDKDVLQTIRLIESFLSQHNKSELMDNSLYKELIFTWICNAVIFKYPQKYPFSSKANGIVRYILKDYTFRKYIYYFVSDVNANKKWKIISILALYAYPLFVLVIYIYSKFKNKLQ